MLSGVSGETGLLFGDVVDTDLKIADRKEKHNQTEQRRRQKINERILQLQSKLEFGPDSSRDRASILKAGLLARLCDTHSFWQEWTS